MNKSKLYEILANPCFRKEELDSKEPIKMTVQSKLFNNLKWQKSAIEKTEIIYSEIAKEKNVKSEIRKQLYAIRCPLFLFDLPER